MCADIVSTTGMGADVTEMVRATPIYPHDAIR